MSKSKTDLAQQFEKFTTPTPPAQPRDFESIASNAKTPPPVGYAREFQAATERGRAAMAQQAEQRGIDSFPPAKELKK